MVAEALDITRETYFAILMDREHNGPVMVGSPAGGMDIEEVAEKTPHLIFKVSWRNVQFKKIKNWINSVAVAFSSLCEDTSRFLRLENKNEL